MKIKDEHKRQQILAATARIIIREGAAAVSTTKVAKRVGIGQSSLYTYFANKQALLVAVFNCEQQKLVQLAIAAGVNDTAQSVKQRLISYVQVLTDFAVSNPDSLALIEQIKFLPDFNGPNLNDPANPVVQLFQAGIEAGLLQSIDVSLYIAAVFAVARRHGENIRQGQYPANQISTAQILHLVLGANFNN
ncbi:TetR/AcrR family transcriptional regulator [Loigolactobacillus jiayinensis]|uniref:TetR/AcrR family transcriptional regulator n=1 Tax=Loigolactobacillus jiayinensis TaxID=2486016 RepID=A0ABW1RFA5_9LACO|nr:TetR/AcrR family transcriptional regulator [Loigolactobacillus jiayinensis]